MDNPLTSWPTVSRVPLTSSRESRMRGPPGSSPFPPPVDVVHSRVGHADAYLLEPGAWSWHVREQKSGQDLTRNGTAWTREPLEPECGLIAADPAIATPALSYCIRIRERWAGRFYWQVSSASSQVRCGSRKSILSAIYAPMALVSLSGGITSTNSRGRKPVSASL